MRKYIAKMNIDEFEDENGNVIELLDPRETYNPHL